MKSEESKPILGMEEIARVCTAAGETMKAELAGAAPSGLIHDLALLIANALCDLGRTRSNRDIREPLVGVREHLRPAVEMLEPVEQDPQPRPIQDGIRWLHGTVELSRKPDVRLDIPAEHFEAAAKMAGLGLVDDEEPSLGHYPGIIAFDAAVILNLFDAEYRSGIVFDEAEESVTAVRLEVVDLPDEYINSVLPSYFLELGKTVEQG